MDALNNNVTGNGLLEDHLGDEKPLSPTQRQLSSSTNADGFVQFDEYEDDDDLMRATQDEISAFQHGDDFVAPADTFAGSGRKKHAGYLERDDFESELGSPADAGFFNEEDIIGEDFSSVARYDIVDVVGDDTAGRTLVVIYGYRLPHAKMIDHNKFLRYLTHTLDGFVDQDYAIIYFHYGLTSNNKPSITWLVKAYRLLDRRFKKNLKGLYVVHPTTLIRLVWSVFRPFVSTKFERKVNYINNLQELCGIVRSAQICIPDVIQKHDRKSSTAKEPVETYKAPLETQQFGVSIRYVLDRHQGCNGVPPIVKLLIEVLRSDDALMTEGLFRRSVSVSELRASKQRIDRGEHITLMPERDAHLAAVLLKTYFRDLPEPILTFAHFDRIMNAEQNAEDRSARLVEVRDIVRTVPSENFEVLRVLVQFLLDVMAKSDLNRMNASNLALVFGPNLIWPKDRNATLAHIHNANNFVYILLTNYDFIFESS